MMSCLRKVARIRRCTMPNLNKKDKEDANCILFFVVLKENARLE